MRENPSSSQAESGQFRNGPRDWRRGGRSLRNGGGAGTKGGESATVYKLLSRKLAGLSAPMFCSNDCRTCVGGKESVSVQESCDPWWETSNEAVVGCTLNTHTLVLRRNQTKKCNFRPLGRLRAA